MSVIIRGMNMPDNCWHCELSDISTDLDGEEHLYCALWGMVDNLPNARDKDCPLEEVKDERGEEK